MRCRTIWRDCRRLGTAGSSRPGCGVRAVSGTHGVCLWLLGRVARQVSAVRRGSRFRYLDLGGAIDGERLANGVPDPQSAELIEILLLRTGCVDAGPEHDQDVPGEARTAGVVDE